ncbi:MAG: PEP-utilizing enzyme [Solirubrobacterales bacterium]
MSVIEEYKLIGTGQSVYVDDEPVEGPVVWLDSPKAVLDFVGTGRVKESIVVSRGGTTTFLTPVLTSGVKGVITLQGAPESHLGILSREYGIPCVMSVAFEDGVRSDRGEVIPADGATVRIDVSELEGRVYAEPDAPSMGARGEPTEEEKILAAQMEQIAGLLENYRGEVPHGPEGDSRFRAGLTTDVLELTDDSVRRDLTVPEANDLLDYMGWHLWDVLAARATEGESGLIPRQEYEAVGCIQDWQRFPQHFRRITKEIGVDGLIELGATPRREIGSKLNQLHMWCTAFTPLFGRGILVNMGRAEPGDRAEDVKSLLQYMRTVYKGFWGDGPVLGTARGYAAPVLGEEWLERLRAEITTLDDEEHRAFYQRFSASTELMGFLLHFDNRAGLCDSGPYPLPDGSWMIVRDHFLHDPIYHWHDVAEELPHSITQAMVFKPDTEMTVRLLDIGTIFTQPANYLRHLKGIALFARDSWDTPASGIRRLGEDEMKTILGRCETASARLYRRIAAMSPRERIMAGATVYYAEFVAPWARAAGVWDELVEDHDFFELDPVASEAYYPLVKEGTAQTLVPEQFLMGTAYQHIPPTGDAVARHFPALHAIALRGLVREAPEGSEELERAGLVVSSAGGYMLSEDGRRAHDELMSAERAGLDGERLGAIYRRFLDLNTELKKATTRWQDTGGEARRELLAELGEIVERVKPMLRRAAELVPRLEQYADRLGEALRRVERGDDAWAVSPERDSIHTVWMELHEDLIQLLGRDREAEGSF